MKKVVFDATTILPGRKLDGIGRTTRGLLDAFSKMELPFELVLFTQKLRGKRLQDYSYKKCNLPLPKWQTVSFFEEKFPIKELYCKGDLYHIPHNFAPMYDYSKVVLTIHDAMFFSYPENFKDSETLRTKLPKIANKCKAIITISEASKKDIIKYLNVDEDKIHVIPWGIDLDFFIPSNNLEDTKNFLKEKFNIKRPYFLSVSCNHKRKNTLYLVEEYNKLTNPKHDLVLVWKNIPTYIKQKIISSKNSDKIHILEYVDDIELRELYRNAEVMVFPSWYEGFGLPILEAMACGTVVVTTPFSALPEVGGNAAIYINPKEPKSLLNVLERFENNKINKKLYIKKGLEHVKKFTWENTALKTIEVYKQCLGD